LLATALARSASRGADPTTAHIPVARRAAGWSPRSSPPLASGQPALGAWLDLPLFRCSGCPAQIRYARVTGCLRLRQSAGGCGRCRHGCRRRHRIGPIPTLLLAAAACGWVMVSGVPLGLWKGRPPAPMSASSDFSVSLRLMRPARFRTVPCTNPCTAHGWHHTAGSGAVGSLGFMLDRLTLLLPPTLQGQAGSAVF
jgi:hypothetical protein